MRKFLAMMVATLVAAQDDEVAFDEQMEASATLGQQHVDLVVEDPYTLSGIENIHGTEECMHAIGHDGTYEYIRLVPTAESEDYANCSGDYIESTRMLNGKHIYVNFEKDRFMGWTTEGWSLTANGYMEDIFSGAIASPFGGFHFGTGDGDKPESFESYSVQYETDMDLEPEWRCLMRPLLR